MPLTITRRDFVLLGLAALLVAVYVGVAGWGFPLDDSWIHQTYGRNLAQYGEWAFIPGQPSAASTSPLYTVILSVGYAFGLPYLLWTHAVGALALGFAGMMAARMTAYVLPQARYAAWVTGLAVVLTWHLIWAAASGMETMIFSMLTLVLIMIAWHELDDRSAETIPLLLRGATLGTVTALTTLARPEGVMLGGIVALLMLIVRPQGSLHAVVIYGSGAAFAFAVTLAPYLLLNLQLTGGLLPNTASAKFQQHAILLELPYVTRYVNLAQSILAGGQFLLLSGIVAFVFVIFHDNHRLRAVYKLLPILWPLALIATYAARLPAWYQHGRYVIPALPALVVCGVLGTLWLLSLGQRIGGITALLTRVSTRVLAISALLVTLYFTAFGATVLRTDVAIINSEMVASAEWIADNLPPDELLAIHDIGAVGYFAPREMLDIAGLVSPDVVPIVADPDALWGLMGERDARYLMAFPDQIPGRDPSDPRLCAIFTTDSDVTRRVRGAAGTSMTIYRLDYDATCDA